MTTEVRLISLSERTALSERINRTMTRLRLCITNIDMHRADQPHQEFDNKVKDSLNKSCIIAQQYVKVMQEMLDMCDTLCPTYQTYEVFIMMTDKCEKTASLLMEDHLKLIRISRALRVVTSWDHMGRAKY
jgi:hypothetical protein